MDMSKENEYRNYIYEHIDNVRRAFIKYGRELSEYFGISYNTLDYIVTNHDRSKFSDEEFNGYRQYFHTKEGETRDKDRFLESWFHHLRTNKHHPEYWTYVDDNNMTVIMDMPPLYIAEMLLDWEAMAIRFNNSTRLYYELNRNRKPLSKNTKKLIDGIIHIFEDNSIDSTFTEEKNVDTYIVNYGGNGYEST